MAPTFGHGKICYLEIPSRSAAESAEFYRQVFGWQIRRSSEGHLSFDDGVGEVSGSWIEGRQAADGGLIVSIMVDDRAATLEAVRGNGGAVVADDRSEDPGRTALFRDPSGNLFGIYQHSRQS